MAGFDNLHSFAVYWLKILLPLGALAILSTLFLLSRTIDPEDALPYAQVDVEELARQPRLTAPEYAGVTDDGAAITVTAVTAIPGDAKTPGLAADAPKAVLETAAGLRTEISAAEGRIDPKAGLLTLTGGVSIVTSSGYSLATDAMSLALDRTLAQSDSGVFATAPFGDIAAGGMILRAEQPADTEGEAEGGAPAYVLLFNNGVKLVYLPEQ